MKNKIRNVAGVSITLLGGLLVFGAAGAAECGTYTMWQAAAQAVLGIVLAITGAAVMPAYVEMEE